MRKNFPTATLRNHAKSGASKRLLQQAQWQRPFVGVFDMRAIAALAHDRRSVPVRDFDREGFDGNIDRLGK